MKRDQIVYAYNIKNELDRAKQALVAAQRVVEELPSKIAEMEKKLEAIGL